MEISSTAGENRRATLEYRAYAPPEDSRSVPGPPNSPVGPMETDENRAATCFRVMKTLNARISVNIDPRAPKMKKFICNTEINFSSSFFRNKPLVDTTPRFGATDPASKNSYNAYNTPYANFSSGHNSGGFALTASGPTNSDSWRSVL